MLECIGTDTVCKAYPPTRVTNVPIHFFRKGMICLKKTVIVTGGSRGIGAETARLFAAEGYSTIINYNRSKAAAEAVRDSIVSSGGCCDIFGADLSRSDNADALIDFTLSRFGGVDVLINNAGISSYGLTQDITDEEWRNIFAVNTDSAFYCSRAVLPHMISKKSGRIINISSIWGICGASLEVAYSASKAALIGFTKALAKEVGPSGITVNCVAPGVTATDMCASLSEDTMAALADETPMMRIGTPSDIAESILFLASDKASFITGQVLSPNGGIVI